MAGIAFKRTLLGSGARTTTTEVVQDDTPYYDQRKGLQVIINVTAIAATPSVVPTIEGYEEQAGVYYTLLTGAAITGTGLTVLTVYPGIAAVANLAVSNFLPPVWKLKMTHGDADSITYYVGAHLSA